MAVRTRGECSDLLVTLLKSEVKAGVKDLVEDVFDYIPTNPQGISPFVSVVPSGTDRTDRKRTSYSFNLYAFVLAADSERGVAIEDSWTTLNQLSEAILDVIDRNRRAEGYWTAVYQIESTIIDTIVVENHGYLFEVCPLRMDLY